MFERYTEKARRVIFFARYEASQFGATAIEAEHILLGVLREDKGLVQALFTTANTDIAIRSEIESRTELRDKVHASVDLPLSAGAKAVLSHAAAESDRFRDCHIGTQHLMLGLIMEEQSLASELLRSRGVTAAKVVAFINNPVIHDEEKADPISSDDAQAAERLSRPLVDRLAQKGLLTREEFMGELLGRGASISVLTAFNRLLDLLVRKGVISADERQEISTGQG